ncbi:MAG: ATP-binding protein [Candidatus Methanoliparum thermophilum]|uniref:Iron-sulfur cluster carrier protein n=1 Tax=Methanoliparum thermophilum TaxID=2491083 RepID=A0A520KQD8_METT2|nr:Mrp/NBP35 family ATP-binding protein [Candidatus Methanoliparum sp. LAM-1]RZN63792.1 MAG: ATP-binding protein [Candidatus Methanoliparum thermophilum]BDC36486.1 ATP-binding protein [Candidatus Methanoliparum sp. LAM-1]
MSEKTKDKKAIEALDLGNIKHIIMIISGKGGVGKSTVSVNLAYTLAKKDKQVGLLDADIHGPTVPKLLGVSDRKLEATEDGKIKPIDITPNLRIVSMGFLLPNSDSPVIWRGPMKYNAIRQFLQDVDWNNLDYLVVDLPPGTGDEAISIAQLTKADGSIIVTTPQNVALLNSRKAIGFAQKLDIPIIGIIENMSGFICPNCGFNINIFGENGGLKAAKEFGLKFLGKIPLDLKIYQSGENGNLLEEGEVFKEIADQVLKFYKDL